jgi:FimV-like protein
MMELIVRSYSTELFDIGTCAFLLFLIGSFFILRVLLFNKKKALNAEDLGAIAGDDVMATQLDLARAYLEADHKQLAKEILLSVLNEGSSTQRQEAQQLLSTL